MDTHRAPTAAAGTRWGRAAVAGDARAPAVSVGSDPRRAHRDAVDPVGELPRDQGEAAAPADLDTGRNSCLGILTIRSGAGIPPEGTNALLVVQESAPSVRSASGARYPGREQVFVLHSAEAVSRALTTTIRSAVAVPIVGSGQGALGR